MSFRPTFFTGLVLVVALCVPAGPAQSQALPSLASISVSYSAQKTKVQPAGELKAQIDALDRDIADATRLGRTGELRRLYAKGLTLLSGQAWTADLDFARSLVLRTDRLIVDPASPWSVRLEQIYQASIALEQPLVARIAVRRPSGPATRGMPAQDPIIVKDFGTRSGVPRDLRESPLHLTLDLADLDDGRYQLVVEVLEGARSLGSVVRPFDVYAGLDATVARLHRAAAAAPEALRASILFPVDRTTFVNRGDIALAAFNPAVEFPSAEAVATAAAAGTNVFDGRTGDFKRHYRLESAGEIMPYRLYVPTTYSSAVRYPLVMALHGLGGDEDSLFTAFGGQLQALAERHGFIVAAPFGYRADGWFGWDGYINRDDPDARRRVERSEDDVMQVMAQVTRQYSVDDQRIFLMGHSMGAIGTWHLAAKFPDVWAGLGPIAGIGDPATIDRMRHIPQFVVHGDADATVAVGYSRVMVARMQALGMSVTYIEVPGGDHINIAVPNLPAMFEFFGRQRCTASGAHACR